MIAPKDVIVLDQAAHAKIDEVQKEIDQQLRSTKGFVRMAVEVREPGQLAFWNEIVRMYKRAGWLVRIEEPERDGASPQLLIQHPAYQLES